jgi:hypothetical protein
LGQERNIQHQIITVFIPLKHSTAAGVSATGFTFIFDGNSLILRFNS